MKVYQTHEIRNIVLMGSSGTGKTTLAEAIHFNSGHISRRGEVEKGNTVSDFKEIEQAQKNSVFTSLIANEYNSIKINVLDTPGNDDFIASAIAALKVADLGIILIDAYNSVTTGSEVTFKFAKEQNKPIAFFINNMDHEHANFEKTFEDIKELLSNKATLVQYPLDHGPNFNSIIDLISMKKITFSESDPKGKIEDIPESEKSKAQELHNALIEKAAEADEELMEKFFENGTLTEEEFISGLKKGLLTRELFPVFVGSAKKNYSVVQLMNFIVKYAPNPAEMPPAKAEDGTDIVCNSELPTVLFFFKTMNETHIGDILFFKVMQGKVTENQDLISQARGAKERVSQLLVVQGKNKEKVPELYAGDLGATLKLKEAKFGDSLCDKSISLKVEKIKFPAPKFWIAIKAENDSDDEKLASILNKYHEEDPTLIVEYDRETKQTVLRGQGEYHINTLKWHLDNIYKIPVKFFPAKIPYRETVTKPAWAMYRHKKQSGGAGQFGEVHLIVEPYVEGKEPTTSFKFPGKDVNLTIRETQEFDLEWGGKFVFHNCIVGGAIDKNFMPAIIKGIFDKLKKSPLTGSFVRDVRVYVFDGKMHPVDSNEISFVLAGRNAFNLAFKEAAPKIMEPIYNVDIIVPSENLGDVMSDLQTRRAIIMGMENLGRYEHLKAKVPLAEMNRYSTTLSSITSGRGTYMMSFDEYVQVPPDIQEKLIKELAKEAEEEE